MQYVEAINHEKQIYPVSVFLGGGITNCVDWQQEVVNSLAGKPVTVFNPRRKNFDVTNPRETERQIDWEYQYLREATIGVFYFSPETLCPITLFELGAALERSQKLVVASDPRYARVDDVRYQCGKKNKMIVLGLNSLIKELGRAIDYANK